MFADCKRVEEIAGLAAFPERNADAPLVLRGAFAHWPIVAAHASEIPTGSILPFDALGVPIVLTRSEDGRARAFVRRAEPDSDLFAVPNDYTVVSPNEWITLEWAEKTRKR